MDCVQAKALRTSFGPEMALKSTQHAFFDDGWCGNGPNVVASDDFFVDDLLNFSNEDVEQGFVVEEEKDCSSVSSQEAGDNDNSNTNSSAFSFDDDFGSLPGSELSVPADDLASLEWLSHFVDDSFDEFTLPSYPAENPTEKPHQNHQKEKQNGEPQTETSFSLRSPYFPALVPAKKRSKRSRTSGRKTWSLGSPSSFTDSSSTTTTTSSSSSSSSSPTSRLIFTNRGQDLELFYCLGKPPLKKQNKKQASENSAGGSQLQRRCSHCHVQKTPQWRTGPLGAKTLCNACGVRYKSGRLLPEYRPACSPTFSNEIHSNNHRKVLEMRKKKEMLGPESGLTSAVQSF